MRAQPTKGLRVRLLGSREVSGLIAFLSADKSANLFMLSWAQNYGAAASRGARDFFILGALDFDGELRGAALCIGESLLMLCAPEEPVAWALGRWVRARGILLDHVVSKRASVEPFWRAYARAPGPGAPRARRISEQYFYVLEPDDLRDGVDKTRADGASEWRGERPRKARAAELDAVFLASARMHQEETGEDPLRRNPASFREHISRRISSGRVYVCFDSGRRLLFKCDLSALSSFGVQIAGVYTAPRFRGQGIATRAIFDICRELFDGGTRRITLYVNADNAAAHRVYERVGFQFHAPYQTVFVESDNA